MACECSDAGCRGQVLLTRDELEFVRAVPSRLVVKVGHAHHDGERVLVEEPDRFQVVEQYGPAGDIAAHLYLRARTRRRMS